MEEQIKYMGLKLEEEKLENVLVEFLRVSDVSLSLHSLSDIGHEFGI